MTLTDNDFALILGTVVWLGTIGWMWRYGWAIQHSYVAGQQRAGLSRVALTWSAAIAGVLTLIASHQRPGAPSIIVVAMVGFAAAFVDVRTHRLPDRYTVAMAVGLLIGWFSAFLVDPGSFLERLTSSVLGALIWFLPLLIGSRVKGGVGLGDVKLAPVLGAVVGMLGVIPALMSLLLSFISAGVAALWLIVTGSTSIQSRIALGPWLIGSAIAGHILWGVIPDWI